VGADHIFFVYVRLGMLGSFVGLVLAHSMLAVPFVVVTTLSGLRAFDPTQERAALSLGCTRWQAFRMVTLPQIRGSVLSGLLFAFVTSMDEVVVSIFVAAGSNMTITKVMFTSLRDELDPTIAAVSTILISGSIILASAAALARRVAR
jgi:putative spermidine/putrescine transport system permease protein